MLPQRVFSRVAASPFAARASYVFAPSTLLDGFPSSSSSSSFFSPSRSFAGHSKWAKIARSKGATDAQKSILYGKLSRAITAAVKAGGGSTDPLQNARLADALEAAKRQHLPRDVMERALKSKSDVPMESVRYEGTGPGRSAFMIECLTDNRRRTAAAIRSYLTKSGGELSANYSKEWLFQMQGEISVVPPPGTSVSDADWWKKLYKFARTVGATELCIPSEGGGDRDSDGGAAAPPAATVVCEKGAVASVRAALETDGGYTVVSARVVRRPTSTESFDPESDEGKALAILFEKLDADEDVQDYTHNVDIRV